MNDCPTIITLTSMAFKEVRCEPLALFVDVTPEEELARAHLEENRCQNCRKFYASVKNGYRSRMRPKIVQSRREPSPEVVRENLFSIQVCVPKNWSNEEVTAWVNDSHFSGTAAGWMLRKQECYENGDLERTPCKKQPNCVHIVFDC